MIKNRASTAILKIASALLTISFSATLFAASPICETKFVNTGGGDLVVHWTNQSGNTGTKVFKSHGNPSTTNPYNYFWAENNSKMNICLSGQNAGACILLTTCFCGPHLIVFTCHMSRWNPRPSCHSAVSYYKGQSLYRVNGKVPPNCQYQPSYVP